MAILRQENWLGQQRVDVPHLRSIESASCGDFDMLVGRALAGAQSLVVTGFDIANPVAAVGSAATGMQLNVANSILINLNASESGSMFWQSTGTNPAVLNPVTNTKVQGAFTASTYNYIGLDLTRTADTATSDLVEFLDPNTDLEDPEIVPLARTLSYVIVISTATFASQPNLVPIAIVLTDGSNNVSTITDARNLYGRLGLGGDTPNAAFQYTWPQGRAEDTDTNVFQGGDKAIGSQKDWMNATMSRIWEVGGGEYWYSRAADRNVIMVNSGAGLSDGDWWQYTGGSPGTLTWTGVTFLFDNASNSGVYYNDVENNASVGVAISNGQCLYVVLDRTQNHVRGVNGLVVQGPVSLNTVGSGLNYADLQIIAWVEGGNAFIRGSRQPVGFVVPPATTSTLGLVELFQTPGSSSFPVVLNLNSLLTLAWVGSNTGTPNPGLKVTGGNATTAATLGGIGLYGLGGTGNTSAAGGPGVQGLGGTGGTGTYGGPGLQGTGGPAGVTTAQGGNGVVGIGGTPGATSAIGGVGVYGAGSAGGATSGPGGNGGYFQGGAGTVASSTGGGGLVSMGGAPGAGGTGGPGGVFTAGAGALSGQFVGGSIQLQTNSAYEYTYSPGGTSGKAYFQYISSASMNGTFFGTYAAAQPGSSVEGGWEQSGGAMKVNIPLKGVPPGATILLMYLVVQNSTGSDQTWTWQLAAWESTTLGGLPSVTFGNFGGTNTSNLSVPAAGGAKQTVEMAINNAAFQIPECVTDTDFGYAQVNVETTNVSGQTIFGLQVWYVTENNHACYSG